MTYTIQRERRKHSKNVRSTCRTFKAEADISDFGCVCAVPPNVASGRTTLPCSRFLFKLDFYFLDNMTLLCYTFLFPQNKINYCRGKGGNYGQFSQDQLLSSFVCLPSVVYNIDQIYFRCRYALIGSNLNCIKRPKN